MFTETRWLSVGQAGVVQLNIPVYTIGNGGRPAFGITCSVHGDEPSGLYIVARLLDYLKQVDEIDGTIHIIPAANPAAQLVNKRVSPLDLKDLNRTGRGRKDGTFTDRVGACLFDFLSQCDLVINIHEFEMHTPVTAVFMNAGDPNIKTKTLAAIKAFAPDILWVINPAQDSDIQYQATLDTALAQAGIANFPIETTQLAFLSEDEIDKAALGLFQVAAYLGICKSPLEPSPFVAPALFRQEVTASEAGLWEPNCKLMEIVAVSEQIGAIRHLTDFQQVPIQSPSEGVLVQYRHRQLVATGTSLFSLGHNAGHVISPYLSERNYEK